ncbi:MAG TPA: type II toxin-antitoxin system MqsA family antitoxin [Rubrivivax sp.]|nr:type II toxin-antitoxin system MqsA family antitoxin [Rubrivivax sp.]
MGLGLCPVCRKGHLEAAERVRVFEPHGKRVDVKLQTSVCNACGETTTKASQHRENLRVLAERKVHYGDLLMGEEILALRKRYGLTQQQASKVFGKGKIAFSRYESETTYPDESTTLLLKLAMERPDVMKDLAVKAEVELTLWSERCEDEQRVKLRALPTTRLDPRRRDRTRVSVPMPGRSADLSGMWGAKVHLTEHLSMTACNDAASSSELMEAFA